MDGDSLDVLTVFVRGPDIAQIGEDDPALVVMRITNESGLTAESDERQEAGEQQSKCITAFHTLSLDGDRSEFPDRSTEVPMGSLLRTRLYARWLLNLYRDHPNRITTQVHRLVRDVGFAIA